MRQRIIAVDNDSIAEELGIKPGFFLLRINGEDVEDVIDYEQLTAETQRTDEQGKKLQKQMRILLYRPNAQGRTRYAAF